jgi:N-acetylglucosaminyl-diphospho-decaprenol L-rhamnosyltransferase
MYVGISARALRAAQHWTKTDSMETQISVILVSWNCWPHLNGCLESLKPCRLEFPMEIIVVDNASNDGTRQELERCHPDVQLIALSENTGFAAAANRGLAAASCDLLWLLNPDTRVLPDTLRRLIDCCQAHPEAGMVGAHILDLSGATDRRSAYRFPTIASALLEQAGLRPLAASLIDMGPDWRQVFYCPVISGASMLMRREVLDIVGPLDERFFLYSEDVDLCRRLWAAGRPVLYCGAARLTHVGACSSAGCADEAGIQAILSMQRYLRKHHGSATAEVYRAAVLLISLLKSVIFRIGGLFVPAARRKRRLHCRLMRSVWRGKVTT